MRPLVVHLNETACVSNKYASAGLSSGAYALPALHMCILACMTIAAYVYSSLHDYSSNV